MIYFLSLILALLPAYLIRMRIGSLPTTLLEILVVVFLFITLIKIRGADLKKINKLGKINWAIGLFALAGIISTAVSPETIKALGELKAFIIEPLLIFYASIIIIDSEKKVLIVLRWLFWSASLISLFGIVQYFTLINLPLRFWGDGLEVERISSVFDYPNALALYLAPLFGFFTVLFLEKFELIKEKKSYLFGLCLMLVTLILTFSRGAWLAIIITLGLLLIRRFGIKKTLAPAVILVLLILLVGPIRQRLGLGWSDPSTQARFDLMGIATDKIFESPLFGNGLYGFRTTLSGGGFNGEILNYPHNIFLNFWLELGFLGLISFFGVCLLVFKQYKKRPQPLILAAGVFITILILHGLVDAPYFKNDLAILFWFIVALTYI